MAACLALLVMPLCGAAATASVHPLAAYWEILLRYAAAILVIPAGLFGDIGLIAAVMGLGDLAIGLVYMFGLAKDLGVLHYALLSGHSI